MDAVFSHLSLESDETPPEPLEEHGDDDHKSKHPQRWHQQSSLVSFRFSDSATKTSYKKSKERWGSWLLIQQLGWKFVKMLSAVTKNTNKPIETRFPVGSLYT